MSETNPAPGVDEASILNRLEAALEPSGEAEEESQEAAAAETPQATEEQVTEELTSDDLPDEEPEPQAVDAFEIIHNGQQVKLSREDAIKYAQQGLDYTQKTQAVAAKDREVSQRLERLAQIEQVQGVVSEEFALVKALETQLKSWDGVDWVRVATDEPLEYPKYRAQYDTLMQQYQRARDGYQHKAGAVNEALDRLRQQQLQQEMQALPSLVPAWKDPQKLQADQSAMQQYLQSHNVDLGLVGKYLDNAFAMKVLYQSMKYEQLQSSKAEKVKQLRTAPPVAKPGAAPAKGQVSADKTRELQARLKKSGRVEDAAELLFHRMK